METPTAEAMSAAQDTDGPGDPSSSAEPGSQSLDSALKFVMKLDSSATSRGNIKLHLAVDAIVKHAMSNGLEPSQIADLVDVIVSSKHKLSQAIRSKFVKCLIPSSKVPQAAVVRVLSCISAKIFTAPGPSNLHSLLLRWILLVFDHIDGYDQLHKLYNVVYCFINSHRLLPQACHLLFLLTTRKDVRLFRVHKLLELIKAVGPEPYIMGLLMIYKVYCPHLVTMRLDYGHKVFFKAHDAAWRSTIAAVASRAQEEGEGTQDKGTKRTASEIESRRERTRIQPKSKRQKTMIPESHSAAHEVEEEKDVGAVPEPSDKIPYTQIESFTGFLEVIDRIEYPSQIAACLNDSRLQLLLSCNPDPLVMARLCFWIQHMFAFSFKGTDKDLSERNEKLLHMLYNFSKNVQGLSVVHGFLESFLPTWNGQSYAPLVYSLITCVKPCSYNELYTSILGPLQKIFYSSDVYAKTMCIRAITKMMRNFVLEEKSRQLSPDERPANEEQTDQGRTESEPAKGDAGDSNVTAVEDSICGQSLPAAQLETQDTIYRLISFMDVLIVIGMRMEEDHYLLQWSSLDFLQLISEVCQKYDIPLVCLPMRLIHRLLLSDCPATLARLCGIINLFREAFVTLKSGNKKHAALSLTCDTITQPGDSPANTGTEKFNALLLDVLGMLWQGRMFTDRKHKYESIFRFPLPSHLEGKLKDNALTLYTGPAFLGLAYKFLKETQEEGKKLHPLQIEEFKETYLHFLDRENFPEFMQLVNMNIKRRKSHN